MGNELTLDAAIKKISQLETQVSEMRTYADENSRLHVELEAANERIALLERDASDREDNVLLDELLRQGKLLPKEKSANLAMLAGARGQVSRYMKDGEVKERPFRSVLVEALKARPKIVEYGELSVGSGIDPEDSDPASDVDKAVRKFRSEHASMDYETAFRAVMAANPGLARRYANK